jgi:hypothetical protein
VNGEEAYEHALAQVERNPDGSINEDALVDLIAETIRFDADGARRGLAKRIVARRKRPGQTPPDGQLVLPGLDPFAYEPERLVADDAGRVVENRNARPSFKAAEARRAQLDAEKAQARARREQEEYAIYAEWAMDQLAKGRPGAEITWETCVHEMGLWKDATPESEPGDGGDPE